VTTTKMENVRPLGDRVLILRDKSEEKIGLIHVPDAAKEKTQTGLVLAAGPGKVNEHGQRIEPSVKKGDRVLFSKYAGEGNEKESDHVIVREDDILGVIT